MLNLNPLSSASPPASLALSGQPALLDREGVRLHVAAHLAAKRPIEDLDIAPNRPADSTDFAFVGMTPRRSAQSSWYRCSFCQHDRKFGAGRIVLSSDSRLRLIGDDCWDKHLDKDRYALEVQDFRDYKVRQRFELLRERLRPMIDQATRDLREVLRRPDTEFAFIEQLPVCLKRTAPLLTSQFEHARRTGNRLLVDRSVRDYAAMERDETVRFINRPEALHTVAGIDAALGPVRPIRDVIRAVLQLLYDARHTIDDTDWDSLSNARAAKMVAAVEGNIRLAMRSLAEPASAVANAYDFMRPDNITGLARWSVDHDCPLQLENATVRVIAGGFRFEADDMEQVEIKRPPTLARSMLPDLRELLRLIEVP